MSGVLNKYPSNIIEHIFSPGLNSPGLNLPKFKYNYFFYDEIANRQKDYKLIFNNIQNEIHKINDSKLYEIKKIIDFLARGVKRYVMSKKILSNRVSNAFMKLWEMFEMEPRLISKTDNDLYAFHMAEAPGQFIYCIYEYNKVNRKNITNYQWRANSLVPEDVNKNMYDVSLILGDDYGFIKGNPDKWLWGDDNTGDITHVNNIRYYRKYVQENLKKMNLVTGDAGVPVELGLQFMQKLEICQMVLTLATSLKGSHCVIKHFVPYILSDDKTYKSSGYYMCLLYSYMLFYEEIKIVKPVTSKPNGGEYYIIGINFRGIDDDYLENFYKLIEDYKENMCWFNMSDISLSFSNQVINFTLNLMEMNMEFDKERLKLYKMYNNKKDNWYELTSFKYYEKDRIKFYDKWINDNNFIN